MPIIYATFEDMVLRVDARDVVQLANVDEINDARPYVDQRLAKAGVIIDGFVSSKYGDRSALPVPPLLKEIALDLAFHDMFRNEPWDTVVKARSEAMALLRDIAAGKIKLDDGVIDAQPARPGAVLIEGQQKIFGRDNMGGY